MLYDTTNSFGWMGEVYAIAAGNLATHFGSVTAMPVIDYQAGLVEDFTATIYVGSTYNEPLPAAFLNDVLTTNRPVIWSAFNIWQLSGTGAANAAFQQAYGWDPSTSYFDSDDTLPSVAYKGQSLTRHALAGSVIAPHITMTTVPIEQLASVNCTTAAGVAKPCAPIAQTPSGATSFPWALRSKNLTYIGEVPFSYMTENSRYLAFSDLLFDALDPGAATTRQALVRLEDVSPGLYTADQLRAIGTYLQGAGVPFTIGVIPDYEDPQGQTNDGIPLSVDLTQSWEPEVAEFNDALADLVGMGGTIIQHGTTHQWRDQNNPYDGTSGNDFEFFRARCATTAQPPYTFYPDCPDTAWVIYEGPVPESGTAGWAKSRVEAGRDMFSVAGLPTPQVFEFPHYAGGASDYRETAEVYDTRYERSLYFGGLLTPGAPVNASRMFGQFFPYAVEDVYGSRVVPESLGNYSPNSVNNNSPRSTADVVANAQAELAVRQGVASFFFHPNFEVSKLQEIVNGIKGLGYTFVSPQRLLKDSSPTNVTATPGTTAVALTWDPPAYCAGLAPCSSVTSYVVDVEGPDAPTPFTLACSAGLCDATELSGLANDSAYTATVVAQGPFGAGSPALVTFRTPPAMGSSGPYQVAQQALSDRSSIGVNIGNGNLVLSSEDLSIAGVGVGLSVGRTMNSLARGGGGNSGNRTTLSVGRDVRLQKSAGGAVLYLEADGSAHPFAPGPGGSYVSPAGFNASLTRNVANGQYTMTVGPTGERLRFGANGLLTRHEDRNGNGVTYTYGPDLMLTSILDSQGRSITVDSSEGRINEIVDNAGRSTSYGYDFAGNLLWHIDAEAGYWAYGYDSAGRLASVTDPLGHETTLGYELTSHRITLIRRAHGTPQQTTTTFTYNPTSTIVTDPNGRPTTYEHDGLERITRVVDALGNPRSITYDSHSNARVVTDSLGKATTFTFNQPSNHVDQLTAVAAPTTGTVAGPKSELTYGGSNPNLPTQSKDPQGNLTSYSYDAAGNHITTTNARGKTSTVTLHGLGASCGGKVGQVCTSKDFKGNMTTYAYAANGNLTSVTPPAPLGPTSFLYDSLGRLTSVTDGKSQTTLMFYDDLDRLTDVDYADGTFVEYQFDAVGNLLSRQDDTGTTTWSYDPLNRVTAKTNGDGSSSAITLDGVGNVLTYSDSGGLVTYGYDAVHNLTSLAEPGGSCSLAVKVLCTTFTYDAEGRRTSFTVPTGETISMGYDASGRQTSIVGQRPTDVTGPFLRRSYTYGTFGGASTDLIAMMQEGLSLQTNYYYDNLNRLTSATTYSSPSLTYSYAFDDNSNITAKTRTLAGVPTSTGYSYNAADQLLSGSSFDANGNQTLTSSGVALVYNAANQSISMTPPGAVTQHAFYAGNGQTERTDFGDKTFSYGLLGVGEVHDPLSVTYYTMTPDGQRLSMRTNGRSYYYVVDPQGSVLALVAAVDVARYTYDPYGNSESKSGPLADANPWRYLGAYLDSTTGLYHFGERYYDPVVGRFLSPDPVPGGCANAYGYVFGDPINASDSSGRAFCDNALVKTVIGQGSVRGLATVGGAVQQLATSKLSKTLKNAGWVTTRKVLTRFMVGLSVAGTALDIYCNTRNLKQDPSYRRHTDRWVKNTYPSGSQVSPYMTAEGVPRR